jgi:hypothetical protein
MGTTAAMQRRDEVSTGQLNDLRGITRTARIDEELYKDFETDAQRKVRACLCNNVSAPATPVLWMTASNCMPPLASYSRHTR